MADKYTVLAQFYTQAGLHEASVQLRRRLFDKIQSDGWLGRRILELGCGTGQTACWFSETGFRVVAVDQSESMLAQARQAAEQQGLSVEWMQADILNFESGNGFDLVLALDTLNEVRSIREMEMAFQQANRALAPGKMLLFDLITIQGLVEQWGNRDWVLYDDPDSLMVMARSRFSYETSANTRAYILYHLQDDGWHRDDETHVLRGFSLQAVGALLQRTGFKVQDVINTRLKRYDPYTDETGRAIFIAEKERDLT
jgi:ubiquinone/menaquinone biosynthesis C-methylase UbiE